ncbi:hypothetical protein [Streptomyces sp. NBC_01483]|uniref:hypothetical protein n=1 Tax=Streptomyces sp. NBC_01483 TaxID=2903883 RepID=UPI002E345A68|nr:hypothetical protein [Streptomyces sp. NBC_01483]
MALTQAVRPSHSGVLGAVDTDWGLRGLLRYGSGVAPRAPLRTLHAALNRALSGDAGGGIGFLDRDAYVTAQLRGQCVVVWID